jgi:putative salt-induced outer membrane protein
VWRIALAAPFSVAAVTAAAQTPPPVAVPAEEKPAEGVLPAPVAEMIRAAEPGQLDTIAALARRTQPQAMAEIDAMVSEIRAAHEAEKQRRRVLATQGFTNGWEGEAALGATFTSGNTDERGASGKIDLVKQGLTWRHRIFAEADFQESDGERTRERYGASYQADHRFSPRFYTFGFIGWESDRFAGFNRRFTESAGFGWIAAERPRVRLAFEGGPALRQTRSVFDELEPDADRNRNELSVRGRTNLRWTVVGDLIFTEEAGFVVGDGNDTLFANSALTTKLIGNLSTRLSFDVKHETDPPDDKVKTDTVTRASLVYKF